MPRSPHHDTQGWIEIALVVGLHEETCRRFARAEAPDALPVYDYFGSIVAMRAELIAWSVRRTTKRNGRKLAGR